MTFKRSSGILLHPTSFPGPYGIGDLGPAAYRFIDFLADSGCKLWQVLPLGPTGYGDSPYQCFSAFAGNPYLVSPDILMEQGLLTRDDLADMPAWDPYRVDFGGLYYWKPGLLDKAFAHFESMRGSPGSSTGRGSPGSSTGRGSPGSSTGPRGAIHAEFDAFRFDNASWLQDFALFMALKDANGGIAWNEWPEPLRKRDPRALDEARQSLALQISQVMFRQFLFFRQWNALRAYVHSKGIQIIGDIPIFVAMDSADAWSHRELFYMDDSGQPTAVAGVPPDYFSPTGQLWGNPLYR
ncbi:MAG: 4-alpha-glucanotransferase, partial [Chloroflexi bacterium]